MPSYAFTIGAYRLKHFCQLNVAAIRKSFGDVPILISDDRSNESGGIESAARDMGVSYCCSPCRNYHFKGDYQSLLNSLSFGQSCEADVSVKISQRLIILSPEIRNIADGYFSDPNVAIALPGRPSPNGIIGSKGFSHYPFLTDVIFMRTSDITPEKLKEKYEGRMRSGKYYDIFVEFTANELVMSDFKDRHKVFNALCDHNGSPHLYLRRYQNRPEDYARAAADLGVGATQFETHEWAALEPRYDPRPRAMAI